MDVDPSDPPTLNRCPQNNSSLDLRSDVLPWGEDEETWYLVEMLINSSSPSFTQRKNKPWTVNVTSVRLWRGHEGKQWSSVGFSLITANKWNIYVSQSKSDSLLYSKSLPETTGRQVHIFQLADAGFLHFFPRDINVPFAQSANLIQRENFTAFDFQTVCRHSEASWLQ